MKMTRNLIGAGVAAAMAIGFAASAHADMTSGFYVGLNAGGAVGDNATWTYLINSNTVNTESLGGAAYGIHGGYNLNTKIGDAKLVYGAEIDYSKTNMDSKAPCPNPSWTCAVEFDDMASIRARVGAEYQNVMLYLTAGYGWADMTVSTAIGGTTYPDDKRNGGLVYGMGGEYAFSKNLSARAELMQYHLGKNTYAVDGGLLVDVEMNPVVARAGVSYAF